MRFLIDGQLPPALAVRLNALGHEAEHIYDLGFGDAGDDAIWRYACRNRRIIITKDEDFAAMANRDKAETAVLWIRLGNTTNRALWSALRPLVPEIISAFESGERLVEVR